jgi:cytochrome c-type biogenesis protein CcmH
MRHRLLFVSLLLSLTLCFAQAKESTGYLFDSPVQQRQFEGLAEELRCLVCQNESLWDSNAPLAQDLRREIYNQIKQGESDEAIKQYLVARYGQFILFKPTFNSATYALWVVPFILLLSAFIVIGFIVLRSRRIKQ